MCGAIQVALSSSRLSDADVTVNVHGKYANGKSRVFELKYKCTRCLTGIRILFGGGSLLRVDY